jgi:alkylhydroperoxidase/carboxymuconolactone decarboxylase family protein YurZ
MATSEKERRLARLFAAIVLGDWDETTRVRRSAPAGEPDRAWRETVLQTHVFAGFPRTVEAYGVLDAAGGLGEPDEDEVLGEPERRERGRELFERIYAGHSQRIRDSLAAGHPDFAAWIEGHAYGRVLARPGLSPDRRELLAVVALAAFGQERQLASHVRGALRCGASADEVRETLAEVRDVIGEIRHDQARRIAERFLGTP